MARTTTADATAGAKVTPIGHARATRRPAAAAGRGPGASVTPLRPAAAVLSQADAVLAEHLHEREANPSPPQGTVRIVLADGRVLHATMIRDHRPVFTDEDYAVLARCRDELRAHAATRTDHPATQLPIAA